MSKEYYELETYRAWESFIGDLEIGHNLITSIGRVRGSYGQYMANRIQEKAIKILAEGVRK